MSQLLSGSTGEDHENHSAMCVRVTEIACGQEWASRQAVERLRAELVR